MRNLLPEFIQQHYQQGCFTNNFSVCSMFVDIPGFTQTTEALIRSGQAVGHILTAQGIFVEAEAHYQDALTIRRQVHEPHLRIEILAGIAALHLCQGQPESADIDEILTYLETQSLAGTSEPYVNKNKEYCKEMTCDTTRSLRRFR